jgi:hypothetical protein
MNLQRGTLLTIMAFGILDPPGLILKMDLIVIVYLMQGVKFIQMAGMLLLMVMLMQRI